MTSENTITILLADDHKIIREGLHALLEQHSDIRVVAEAEDGRKAVELAAKVRPDVAILDIGMPDLNGIEATRRITAEVRGIKVIGLSMHSDKRFVSEMFQAGASGYLLKDCASEELARAIRAVVQGQTYISPGIAGVVIGDYVQHLAVPGGSAGSILSGREREVLQLLAEGKTTKQTALCLHVSIKTIETHRQNIMRKLNVYSVAELTKYAVREGLTSLE
ncbi:MAG TPA: response regulator transcription factor [Planctomycetota bacterium]|nr:response regulator transcription factor [Planctomycetota bacterium]HUW35016.1 response regulator transcription factor [Planctomycetota bacterium]